MPLPTLVLDFDGTVCLGDGPVWAYADRVLRELPASVRSAVRDALAGYLSRPWTCPEYADGYVALAALTDGQIAPAVRHQAYLASRQALSDPDADIHSPDGLAELLDELAGSVRTVVLTNAPATGLDAALHRLGLTGRIDTVLHSAGKPEHAPGLLADLLADAPASHLCSVGDLWANDIAPALQLGCVTALIDRTGAESRPAHIRGGRIEDLYPGIRQWALEPETFAARHDPHRRPIPSVADGSVT
jgi:FMN phosphatase YigB (HAD superfamily)